MRRYDLGDAIALQYVATDEDDNPVTVTAAFTLTRPDGTTYSGVPQSGGEGIVNVTIPKAQIDQRGRYAYLWEITGGMEDEAPGWFYVEAPEDEMPPLASMGMLGRKLGYDPEESEADRAAQILDAVSEMIRDVAGKTWLTATGALDSVPRPIVRIAVEAAYRAFTNPEGLTQRSIGDSSKSYDRTGREGGEAVYLTDDEERRIRKAAGISSFLSVTMVGPYDSAGVDPWDAVTAE